MKKIVKLLLVMCLMLISSQAAFANADKETMQDGADITAVKRIAIGQPLYTPSSDSAPNKEILTQILYDASRVARTYVISYDEVANNIKKDTSTDIKALDRRQSAKILKDNVKNYADAYVILTVANNSRTSFFFDVYKADNNQLLYTYEIRANSNEGDTVATYTNLCEQFYKHFERSAQEQLKENSKKK